MKLSLALFPAASVGEQLTVLWPSGKVLPEGGSHFTATLLPSTRSEAVRLV